MMHKLANIIKNELQEHIAAVGEPGACCFTHVFLWIILILYHRQRRFPMVGPRCGRRPHVRIQNL